MITCDRIHIVPFDMKYLKNYYDEFNTEITKYQWPDPFESIEDARSALQGFLNEMAREETLLCSLLSKDDAFIESVEIHGLAEDCPELGIWVKEAEQGKGYAYEALNAFLDYVHSKYGKIQFYYEADIRNAGSIKLLHKFNAKYDIVEKNLEELTTNSGKKLKLQGYVLRVK